MDFAKRAFDHSYHIDPIVRSLMDTDFYKLLMLQFIWKKYAHIPVTFSLKNRTQSVHLTDTIDMEVLRLQLDQVQQLQFRESELVWLRGQTFYGKSGLFEEGFIHFLRTFSLPDYHLSLEKVDGQLTGQFVLEFQGNWVQTTMWEIYALEIINELRYRTLMQSMKRSGLDIMYARAKVKLYDKLTILSKLDGLNLTDFGTRRRHSFLWQEHCVLTAKEVLGASFTGTSNAFLAMKHDLDAKGTNAHELPMVLAGLAKTDEDLKYAQYRVLLEWQNVYRGGLLIMLPDTFGTSQFLENLDPVLARAWTGARPDSKDPFIAGEELLEFWHRTDGKHAQEKLMIFSDGLDVHLPHSKPNGVDIPSLYHCFQGRCRLGFGFGTNLTNDFLECHPKHPLLMKPLSLVCKVKNVDGKEVCKLSDNAAKTLGQKEVVERYRRVFGTQGIANMPVLV